VEEGSRNSVVLGSSVRTYVAVSLSGLVPHGVDSFFYITFGPDSSSTSCPDVERSRRRRAARRRGWYDSHNDPGCWSSLGNDATRYLVIPQQWP
jgi:hypothetical protein